jgi:membrane protein DedA with SNARE-associated domain
LCVTISQQVRANVNDTTTDATSFELVDGKLPAEKSFVLEQFDRLGAWYMDNMNYGTLTVLMAVESSFIPLPSEVVVPPAAYKASQDDGGMNIILVVVFATIGALCGSLFNYFLALWVGRPVVYKFAGSRFGRFCLLSPEKVQKAEDFFMKNSKSATFIGRLLPGVRHLISVPAGLSRMPLLPFMFFTVAGAGIWNIILAIVGYIAHGQADIIEHYSKEITYVMLFLGLLFALYLIYNGLFRKNKK